MKTDKQPQEKAVAELGGAYWVDAAQLGVEVTDGIAMLLGYDAPVSTQRTDADIARCAQDELARRTRLRPDDIKVRVQSGWITLSGVAKWEFQRQEAVGAVRYLTGVNGVSNLIAIETKLSETSSNQ